MTNNPINRDAFATNLIIDIFECVIFYIRNILKLIS